MVSEVASRKVSKNNEKQHHSLIKVLKPKVYIRDACTFKRLVQELTSNAASVPSVPSSPNLPSLSPNCCILTSCQEAASQDQCKLKRRRSQFTSKIEMSQRLLEHEG
ncbi:uncharacterized protein J3R85_005293 [Psidium guajava]|nr:uncharacterized protein J3R85_005293 [Psidium guajava]